jgi:hypothetical protein
VDWGLNSGLPAGKAGAVLFESPLQPTLLWLFWRWGWGMSQELFAWADSILPISASQLSRITGMTTGARLCPQLVGAFCLAAPHPDLALCNFQIVGTREVKSYFQWEFVSAYWGVLTHHLSLSSNNSD